jgi:D-alanyl-D-alanine carboxypeptidase
VLYPTVEDALGLRHRTWRPTELLALAAYRPPLFEPGTFWAYSNTNYIVLGLIVQQGLDRTGQMPGRMTAASGTD